MLISESWLREWVDPGIDAGRLARRLTMAGLEVASVDAAAPPFQKVFVGVVRSCARHPDADKLSVCEVSVGGDELLSIVCGAPNVRADLKVAVAVVGARLPGDFKIRKAKLRGVVSQGMICSARELGLGDEHDGILELPDDAPVGEPVRDYLDLDDQILELELTPNRGDCLGMAGVAREVGALCRTPVTPVDVPAVEAVNDHEFPVRLSAPEGCARYAGRVISGIDPTATTPMWMCERLRRAGIRSLGPVVDVTNYVMIESGQPMHGFDLDQLRDGIDVRFATDGEKLTLLDGRVVELRDDVLLITDGSGPVALAGIMGGENSGVSDATTDIFLESAFFAPESIAGRARRFGLHTDASHRFERGVDPNGQAAAIERATALLIAIAGGEPGPLCVAEDSEHLPTRDAVPLRAARLEALLGTRVPDRGVGEIFERLGCEVTSNGGGWSVTPPSFRFDISLPEDLVEEVARVHDYERIPERFETASLALRSVTETRLPLERLQDALVDRGYQEVITYSFVDPQLHEVVCPEEVALPLANPISADLSVMRTSLWPGLLATIQRNLARQHERLRLFEHGLTFHSQGDDLKQIRRLGVALTGARLPEHWDAAATQADFHDLAGDVAAMLDLTGQAAAVSLKAAPHPALHPGQSAQIYVNNSQVGWLGCLHPERAKALQINGEVFLGELDLDVALVARVPKYREISRYPALRRDISIIVDDDVSVGSLQAEARDAAPDTLRELRVFDVYRGKGIDSGRKSVSLGLILQDSSRTLNDSQADRAVLSVVDRLKREFNGKIRD